MVILTTTFNCEKYVERSLSSIMSQNFKDFKCYITDDMSTDNTVNIIKNVIKNDDRFVLVQNQKKMYQPGNYDQIIRGLNIDDNEICIEVDGDDWLPHSQVFSKIKKIYDDEEVWMTSGSFVYPNNIIGFSSEPTNYDNIRKLSFTLSHIRTWKSWLWKNIKEEDLKDSNGNYWEVAGDLSFMFPMFEMSGQEHYRFIPEVNYVYNDLNPFNDHKVNLHKVLSIANEIRSKPPYSRL